MTEQTVFECATPGMYGSKVYIQETKEGFEARQAVANFGGFNMSESDLEKIAYNPFHEDFHDNFVRGSGSTQEEAIEKLKADSKAMYESLWI